jgi:hypothetical protein
MNEEAEEMARRHLDCAARLAGRDFILAWLGVATQPQQTPTPPVQNRGRRPGPAAPDTRCQWKVGTEHQCKNRRADEGGYCKLHMKKAHLLTSSATTATMTATF